MNAREALFGFIAWLTSREESIMVGSKHTVYDIFDLLVEWADANNLPQTTKDYPNNIRHTKELKHELKRVHRIYYLRLERFKPALSELLGEYENRKCQFGNDYLWQKHEREEVIEAAKKLLEADS